MDHRGISFAFTAAFLSLTVPAGAQSPPERKPPQEMAGYDWEKDARSANLTDAQIGVLRTQGFVVTGVTGRQSFFPYLDGEQLFVTSDVIANTWSVLLEDSVRLLEVANARRLHTFLREAWKQMPAIEKRITGDPAVLGAARNRVQMVMGVALQLSTGEKVDASPQMQKAIDEEARRVVAATGVEKPAWLGAPDPGFMALDYTRFRPRGLYAGNPALERYFRATAWLQAIPFRLSKDDELAAWLMMYVGLDDYENKALYSAKQQIGGDPRDPSTTMGALAMLAGFRDDADLFSSSSGGISTDGWSTQFIHDVRQQWTKSGPTAEGDAGNSPAINDQIAVASADGKPERTFRVLSARRLPDAVMFTDTEKVHPGVFPDGREVAAALGSPLAEAFCKSSDPQLLDAILKHREAFAPGTVYNDCLQATATLLEPADPAAPDLFRSAAWQEKSLQTFLGAWAQGRHTWLLQAKQNVEVLGEMSVVPSGFVEPTPDYFARMAQLALRAVKVFQEGGAYDHGREELAQNYRDIAGALRRCAAVVKADPKARPAEEDEMIVMTNAFLIMAVDGSGMKSSMDEKSAEKLEAIATRLETPGAGDDADLAAQISKQSSQARQKLQDFATLCLQLNELASKQLRHRPLTEADRRFYYDLGRTLAHFMGYDNNIFGMVRDDAPRIADIYSSPKDRQVLEVGIGRPLWIYLLYPWEGKQILTHGAVLPYYQFSSAERLTDTGWAALLNTPQAPAPPEWLKNVTAKPIPEKLK